MHTVATVSLRRAALAAGLCAAVALVAPAHATIYKCDGPDGTPVYQDNPCPAGKELRDFDKDPPTVSVMPLVPAPGARTDTRETLPAKPATDKAKLAPKGKAAPASNANAAERKFLAPGINEGQVLARLGPPDMKSGGGTRKTARWTYLPAAEDPGTLTTLTFESGRLVEVERKVVR
jgi:hypothetical protein